MEERNLMPNIAIVARTAGVLGPDKTIAKAAQRLARPPGVGAELIVFNEAFVPGYPAWIWRLKPSGDFSLSETCIHG